MPSNLAKKYEMAGSYPVKLDLDNLKRLGVKLVTRKLIEDSKEGLVRHSSNRVARAIYYWFRKEHKNEKGFFSSSNKTSEKQGCNVIMAKKITVNTIQKYKDNNEKFSVLTAYDYSTAKYIDEAGIDIILIGDSLAMVALGYETTHSIGVDEMAVFTGAVARGVSHAMVVTDMPFLSYHCDISAAVANCGKMIKLGANAVKIEGYSDYILSVIKRLVESGIPVMGHLGFTPQFLNTLGGYKIQMEKLKKLLKRF